jgi:hypothetical protein
LVGAQAMKIKRRILSLHVENKLMHPLDNDELTAIDTFEASKQWVSKKSNALGWKSVTLHGEAAEQSCKETG